MTSNGINRNEITSTIIARCGDVSKSFEWGIKKGIDIALDNFTAHQARDIREDYQNIPNVSRRWVSSFPVPNSQKMGAVCGFEQAIYELSRI